MNSFLKSFLITLLYIFLMLFQLIVVNNYTIFNITLNLFLVLIVVAFMNFNRNISIVYSLITGILLDVIFLTNGFGYYTFCYTLIGVVLYFISLNKRDNYSSLIFYIALATTIFELIAVGRLLFVYSMDFDLFGLFFRIILASLLNIAPSLALNFIIQKIKYGNRKITGIYMN